MSERYQQHSLSALERQAHVLAGGGRHTPTAAELKLARQMSHDGASFAKIKDALGWNLTASAVRVKLLRFNIRPRRDRAVIRPSLLKPR